VPARVHTPVSVYHPPPSRSVCQRLIVQYPPPDVSGSDEFQYRLAAPLYVTMLCHVSYILMSLSRCMFMIPISPKAAHGHTILRAFRVPQSVPLQSLHQLSSSLRSSGIQHAGCGDQMGATCSRSLPTSNLPLQQGCVRDVRLGSAAGTEPNPAERCLRRHLDRVATKTRRRTALNRFQFLASIAPRQDSPTPAGDLCARTCPTCVRNHRSFVGITVHRDVNAAAVPRLAVGVCE